MGLLSSLLSGSSSDYVRDTELPYIHRAALDADGRDAYDRIRRELMSGNDIVSLRGLRARAAEQAREVWKLVIMDEPRILRSNGTANIRMVGNTPYELEIGTMFPVSEERRRLSAIDSWIGGMINAMRQCRTDREKAEIAYRAIIDCTDYGIDDDGNQTMDSVFLDRFSCCAGYSHAFQYAMELVGIPCAYIDGYTNGRKKTGAHAWNLVTLDGRRCWVDVTWGDPVMGGNDGGLGSFGQSSPASGGHPRGAGVRMDYLCIPDSELMRTHTVSPLIAPMTRNVDDGEYDWYYTHDLKFAGPYNAAAVEKAVQADMLGREVLHENDEIANIDLKFTDENAYETARERLFAGGQLISMVIPVLNAYGLTTDGRVSLSENDEIGVLHFAFRKIRM